MHVHFGALSARFQLLCWLRAEFEDLNGGCPNVTVPTGFASRPSYLVPLNPSKDPFNWYQRTLTFQVTLHTLLPHQPRASHQSRTCRPARSACRTGRMLHHVIFCTQLWLNQLQGIPEALQASGWVKGMKVSRVCALAQADGNSTGIGNPPGYCYKEQPAWSEYRESSFGHGTLDFVNGTHALWRCALCYPRHQYNHLHSQPCSSCEILVASCSL